MRKFFLSVFILSVLSFVSCSGGNASQVEKIADKVLTAIDANDYDTLVEYATSESVQTVESFRLFAEQKKEPSPDSFKINKVTVSKDGDSATVHFIFAEIKKDSVLSLKKEDGKWKVDFMSFFQNAVLQSFLQ